jgi:dTDP-4-dehydrorhamnose 3,5-epimerase
MSERPFFLTPLKRVSLEAGDVMHALKASQAGFRGFGEAYFTTIVEHAIKGWKRHRRMTLNLVVPVGHVRFVVSEPEIGATHYHVVELGPDNYQRLTLPPAHWFAFQGRSATTSLILNIADIEHDPDEGEQRPLSDFGFDWT